MAKKRRFDCTLVFENKKNDMEYNFEEIECKMCVRFRWIAFAADFVVCVDIKTRINATVVHNNDYDWQFVAEHCFNFHS